MVGREVNGVVVESLDAGRSGKGTGLHFVVRCRCGTRRSVSGAELRRGRSLRCHSCWAAEQMTTDPRMREHQRRLSLPVWPRTCKTCGGGFTGTSRQQYCPGCGPPSGRKKK